MSIPFARVLLCCAITLVGASAMASSRVPVLLKFEGAIGVDPLTAAGAADAVNTVRGIAPGGRAWVIRKFEATVYADASVEIIGKGLLLSSGEGIATRGAVTHVAATLACGAADPTAVKWTTGLAALSTSGSFRIRGSLMDGANTAVLPSICANPQLLIRAANPTSGVIGGWFAVGIQELDD